MDIEGIGTVTIPGISDGSIATLAKTIWQDTYVLIQNDKIQFAALGILLLLGIILLLNQRKLHKELKEIREMMEQQNKEKAD